MIHIVTIQFVELMNPVSLFQQTYYNYYYY